MDALSEAVQKVGASMYNQGQQSADQQSANQQGTEQGGAKPDDKGSVDADFKEVPKDQ